ncbi:MAG: STAS domain-containing protein [Candidatus Aminicenantes bacterium]|nr:STAS domain-containing protein [Candidatus Aminicenantes bacterium]
MKIEKRKNGDVTILDLKGKILFGEGIEELRQSIDATIKGGDKQLVLNFAEVPYLDSTGLGEVVRSYTTLKKEGGTVKILNLSNKVKDLMTVTKLITVFEAFDDENEAVKSFQ